MFASLFSSLKIREKIRLISWLASGFALLLIIGVYSYAQHQQLTQITRRHAEINGAILAANVADALYNLDADVANTQLQSIQSSPYIYSVCLFDMKEKPFGFYINGNMTGFQKLEAEILKATNGNTKSLRKDDQACFFQHEGLLIESGMAAAPGAGKTAGNLYKFNGPLLGFIYPVIHRGKPYGYLSLTFATPTLWDDLEKQAPMLALLFAAGMLVAMLLSDKLQKLVSSPIIDLANTMRRIAEEKNYNLRMKRSSQDEIGVMIDQFNLMLSEIDYRDRELLTNRINLENTVLQRTREMERTRSELQASRDFFRRIVDLIPEPLFVKDSDFRYLLANSAFLKVFPENSSPIGKTDYDIFPREYADRLRAHDTIAFENESSRSEEKLPIGGTLRNFTCYKVRIKDEGGRDVLISLVKEIPL